MIYGSVCSGIEAASVAWHPLGWRASFLSEIEAFPRAVLKHHYQKVPLRGDFTEIEAGEHEPIDVLVGGTPCQAFSIAGLRGGLADERGNLALEYIRLAERLRPRWLVWENVPGVLSSFSGPDAPSDLDEGVGWQSEEVSDFGCFLSWLAECGYGFAYRVLDAQYFGLAQRRKRVFVVGYLGDWRRAAEVLFEPASLRGDSAPRREAREDVAKCLTHGSGSGQRYDGETETFVTVGTQRANGGSNGGRYDQHPLTVAHSLRGEGFDASEDGTGRGVPIVPIAFGWQNSAQQGDSVRAEVTPTLDKSKTPAIATSLVRRLTPRECERLQGFHDDYTLIPYGNGMAGDGIRYKALGNSMAVPVMAWIGRRIAKVDQL